MNMLKNNNSDNRINRCVFSKKKMDADILITLVGQYMKTIPFNGKDTFLSQPMILKSTHLLEYHQLSKILNKALKAIVLNYFKDQRIREIYQLDDELEAILQLGEGINYNVGMYRPDFVIDKSGQHKICEIGCRYPVNGWMLSYYMNLIVEQLGRSVDPHWQSIPNQNSFISELSKGLDVSKTIFYVYHLAKETEAYDLFRQWEQQGFRIKEISPDELEIKDGKLMAGNEQATQFILEMDREELRRLPPEILKGLLEADRCLNDIRSLILVHDKRVLTVLYHQEIMRDYMSNEEYEFLKPFLIPSITLDTVQKRAELIHASSNWILKKNSGGKGIGAYVKSDCSSETWERVITNDWKNYMAQEYIEQEVFDLEHNDEKQQINIVGLLLFYNEQSFGPGIFRGSSERVINVYSGGYIFPSVISNH